MFIYCPDLDTAFSITIRLNERCSCTDHLYVAVLSLVERSQQRLPPPLPVLLPHAVEGELEAAGGEQLPPVESRGRGHHCGTVLATYWKSFSFNHPENSSEIKQALLLY